MPCFKVAFELFAFSFFSKQNGGFQPMLPGAAPPQIKKSETAIVDEHLALTRAAGPKGDATFIKLLS
jgi:hypothetical protein